MAAALGYKVGDKVLLQDGNVKREGTVMKDGHDIKGRVWVQPDDFPFSIWITTTPNENLYIIN